jgi:hypothetical protein
MTERCVGCGVTVDHVDGPTHRYMTSAPACWARYGELLGVLAVDPELWTARLLCSDAYAAQHPGTPSPQATQSVAVHLINSYDHLVARHPIGVPRVVGPKGGFFWLEPPAFDGSRTVFDMPLVGTHDEITRAAAQWVGSVWNAWAAHHAQIARWHAQFAQTTRTARRSDLSE